MADYNRQTDHSTPSKSIHNLFKSGSIRSLSKTETKSFRIGPGHKKTLSYSTPQSPFLKKDISAIPEEPTNIVSDPKLGSSRNNPSILDFNPPHDSDQANQRKDLLMRYHSRHHRNLEKLAATVEDIVSRRVLSPITCHALTAAIDKKKRHEHSKSMTAAMFKTPLKPVLVTASDSKNASLVQTPLKPVGKSIRESNHETEKKEGEEEEDDEDPEDISISHPVKREIQLVQPGKRKRKADYLALTGMDDYFLFEKYPMIQFDNKMLKSSFLLNRQTHATDHCGRAD